MSDNDVSVVRGYTFTSVGRANDAIRSLWIALDRREAVIDALMQERDQESMMVNTANARGDHLAIALRDREATIARVRRVIENWRDAHHPDYRLDEQALEILDELDAVLAPADKDQP